MESGFVTFTRGGLITIGENESYKKEDLIYLSEAMKPFIERTWVFHNESVRQEMLVAIKDVIAKTDYEEVRENLKGLRLE